MSFIEVQVQFQSAIYHVDEGSPILEVCTFLDGEIEGQITVTLISSNITATCKLVTKTEESNLSCIFTANEDYSPVNDDLIITPEQQPSELCVEVVIMNDTILEFNETFSVSITTDEPGVIVNGSETIVTIFDNDGTFSCIRAW